MKNFCLIGKPISKSLSPNIHNSSFIYNKIEGIYTAFEVNEEKLEEAISSLVALDYKGFNVTIPFKEKIFKYLNKVDESAVNVNAVNTVKIINGELTGYNTDYLGFIYTLNERNIKIKNEDVCIIGSGGASKAIAFACANMEPKKITILNRTRKRAEILKIEINEKFKNINVDIYTNNDITNFEKYKLIINCTSVGMEPNTNISPIEIKKANCSSTFYDIIYKPRKTKFLLDASLFGCQTINGIDMLIYQALLSEEIWLNKKLKISDIKKYLLVGDKIGI